MSPAEGDRRPISRRTALQLLGGGAAAGALSACTGGSSPRPAPTSAVPTAAPTTSGGSGPPTAADWSALAAGLDGPLLRPGESGFTAAHELYDPRWDAVVPAAVAQVGGVADISETIRFARRYGVRLAPRGGGHSYLGASSPAGGLVLDTRGLHSIGYDASSGSATIGAGAQLIDVYTQLAAHGRGVPAGTCPTVGLAGLAQGGGLGVFDRAHGLTSDRVVAIDVVTTDGAARTVDHQQDPDLYWALRGGGGGDFAIVTGLRVSTFATSDIGRWSARWSWSQAAAVIAGWQRFLQSASAQSWANLHLDVLSDTDRSVVVIGVSLGGRSPHTDLDALVARVGHEPASTSATVHTHLDTVLSLAGCSSLGPAACHLPPPGRFPRESFVAGSSVPSAWLSSSGIGRLVAAVSDSSSWRGERHAICDPLGGAVAGVAVDATAFPWRRAPFTVQWYAKLPLSHPSADVAAAGRWVAAARSRTASDAPGAYVNYPSADIRDPATYHGQLYSRLRQVKAQYDPDGFLRPPAGVPG